MSTNNDDILKIIADRIASIKIVKDPSNLYEPVDYCLKNGGKRIRPQMTLMGCELFNGKIKDAISAAIGLELLHNFTLMHDDIMDEAPIRRGQPSVYKKYGTNTAILSGDAMLALAYNYMLDVPDCISKDIILLFNKTIIEVCEGQQYDLDFETLDNVPEADYLNMIRLKTAVLPANCLVVGAMISKNVTDADLEKLYKFGEMIGLAFQIQDDRLDVYADEKVFGKKTGGDILTNKKTWLYIKALEVAGQTEKDTLIGAFAGKIKNNAEKIKVVKDIYNQLGIEQLSLDKIRFYYEQALLHLESINVDDNAKQPLRDLAKELLERTF